MPCAKGVARKGKVPPGFSTSTDREDEAGPVDLTPLPKPRTPGNWVVSTLGTSLDVSHDLEETEGAPEEPPRAPKEARRGYEEDRRALDAEDERQTKRYQTSKKD